MIKDWLKQYNPKNHGEAQNSLREIMQEIALAGLYRSGFFEKAAFYGGTALRIFYGLNRFSEDLDFSLLLPDNNFSLQPYFTAIVEEFAALGMQVSIKEKQKTNASNVESAFLKSDTVWQVLVLDNIIPQQGINNAPSLKIKIEVDRLPPSGFETEEKLLLQPFSFYVKCFSQPDLFAGKMHALLFRKWKQRVKGRDWYDLEWYIRKGIPVRLTHFAQRAKDSGDWQEDTISREQLLELLHERISSVSLDAVIDDVRRFIPDPSALKIWSTQYFLDLAEKIKTV